MSQTTLPTVEDGLQALREHVVAKAREARAKHGPCFDRAHLLALLEDRACVRYPTALRFDLEPLLPGEFAWARPVGRLPGDGFELVIHPSFEHDESALPLIVAYHLVTINYFDVATNQEAELFGAALLDLSVDAYYQALCSYADRLAQEQNGSCRGACACTSLGCCQTRAV